MVDRSAFMFPRDVLQPSRPDAHFESEAEAAQALGFDIALIDHDAIVAGDIAQGTRGMQPVSTEWIYRGWMIPPDRYVELERVMNNRKASLRTTAASFRRAHHLPRWFDAMRELTPLSVWTSSADLKDFELALAQLPDGSAVLKDYSKSEKHYWDEAMFIPDVRDVKRARSVAERFLDLRGDYFDGGFVLREFERFGSVEARTWWVYGRCVAVTAHPDTPDDEPDVPDVSLLRSAIEALALQFVTVDVARSEEGGDLRVVEVGDGQVSDRPLTADPSEFITAISGGRG